MPALYLARHEYVSDGWQTLLTITASAIADNRAIEIYLSMELDYSTMAFGEALR